MAQEIKRVMAKYGATEEGTQRILDLSAIELGITPRTLRGWLEPVDKGGWEELQVSSREAMDKLLDMVVKPTKKKGGKKKPGKHCAKGKVFA